MNNEQEKLKHEISKRWHKVREDVIAHAQLEYILTEAGLLAKPRRKRGKKTVHEDPLDEHPMNPINQQ